MAPEQATPSQRLKELFSQAVELPESERTAFLQAQCGDDAQTLSLLLGLIEAHNQAEGFLDRPTLLPQSADTRGVGHPSRVGPYEIMRQIGEGGFGTVYLARQTAPVDRQVAVKILKPGMDSRQILARFNAEKQTLALMDHPNIARVLDAGTTDAGRPFFVMEFVDGMPVTQYCDQQRLSTRDRLELFALICQAVHHAHQKGIIHRDLKPSNVLVTRRDGKPLPKVIDFGVSKAMQQQSVATMMTDSRQLIGTPEYMSPEQAGLDTTDVDTRSDVYSLGVLLYELLTGTTPFDSKQLRAAAMGEMQRIIRELDPPKPSTRLSKYESIADVATCRNTEPRRLASALRGELDWIVMRCLEKDRSRRYESAASLAGDVQNHLSGQPVAAGPPTRIYRLKKFVARNRLPVAIGSTAVLALGVGLVATVLAWRQARIERDRATEARDLAQQHSRFISGMFMSIRPEAALGRAVTVREVLDAAVASIGGSERTHSVVEVDIRNTFGHAYASIGEWNRARDQYRAAIRQAGDPAGYTDPALLLMYGDYGCLLRDLGEFGEAGEVLARAAKLLNERFGPSDYRTLQVNEYIAGLYFDTNRLSEAESLRNDIAARLAGQKSTEAQRIAIVNFGNFAVLKHQLGRLDEAEAMYRKAEATAIAELGPEHPDVFGIQTGLSGVLRDKAQFKPALEVIEPAYDKAKTVFGPDHPSALVMAHHVGLLLSANGRASEAEALLVDALERCRRVLGPDHPTTLYTAHDLFQTRATLRQYAVSDAQIADLVDVVARMSKTFGEDHRDTLSMRADLARVYSARGRRADAIALLSDILPRLKRTMGPSHYMTLSIEMRLGQNIGFSGDWAAAEPYLADAYSHNKASGSTGRDWSTGGNYGVCLTELGKYEEAIPILLESEVAMRKYPRLDKGMMYRVADALARCYEKTGEPQRAGDYRAIAIEMERLQRAATQPATAPATQSAGA